MAGGGSRRLFLVCLVLAALFVFLASASCPNNCNNHGSCSTSGQCLCTGGWAGVDCSIPTKPLHPGTTLRTESVPIRQWVYYLTPDSSSGSHSAKFTWSVDTLSASGDIDIFVQKDRLPTRTDYLTRNITTSPNFTVTATRTGSGNFYVGIFAFSGRTSVSYSIGVEQESACENNCNGHGTCKHGECDCHPDFTGPNCEYGIRVLTINQPVTATVNANEWKYFRIHAIVENTLRVIVNQTTSSGNVDLYVKYNKVPTLTDWDLSDQTLDKNFYLDIQLTPHTFGYWNLGIYGLSHCTFMIKYQQYSECPNNCSLHGVCSTQGCRCASGFTGDYCETKTADLTEGQIVKGFVADNTWNWYTYTPTSTTEMLISVNETGTKAGQDCDVYVKSGSRPTLSNYDARNITLESKMTIRIEEPQFVKWYIGVFGFRACSYFISASSTNKCAQCGSHGTCDTKEGICICDTGYTGEYCDIPVKLISNFSQPLTGNLAQGKWDYYYLEGFAGRELIVQMTETQTVGYFWLFVNVKTPPTLTNFNSTLSDKESNTAYHVVRTDINTSDTWYIGVYGSPFSTNDRNAYPYKLQAWESPF